MRRWQLNRCVQMFCIPLSFFFFFLIILSSGRGNGWTKFSPPTPHVLTHLGERERLLWDMWSSWRVLNRAGLHSLGRHGQPSATALLLFQKWDTYSVDHTLPPFLTPFLIVKATTDSRQFFLNNQTNSYVLYCTIRHDCLLLSRWEAQNYSHVISADRGFAQTSDFLSITGLKHMLLCCFAF